MQKRIRQRIVNILKSKPAVFAPSFIDMLLFSTDSARSELIKEADPRRGLPDDPEWLSGATT